MEHIFKLEEEVEEVVETAGRDRVFRRKARIGAIAKKKRILEAYGNKVDVPGKLNKGKVSCSCRHCRASRTHYGDSNSVKNVKASDLRKLLYIGSQLREIA